MSSFHRTDWLSLAQSVTATVAVIAAFAVARYQHWLEQQSKRADERKMLVLLRDFIYAAYCAARDVDAYRSNRENVETQRTRVAQMRDLAQRLEALNSIQVAALPNADSVRHLVRARNEVSNAIPLIAAPVDAADMRCGEPYGQRWRPFVGALREAYESVRDIADRH